MAAPVERIWTLASSENADTVYGVTQLRALLVGLIALSLAACAPAELDATYVGDSNTGAYTKAPAGWETAVIRDDAPYRVRGFWESGATKVDLLAGGKFITGVVIKRMPVSDEESNLAVLARSIVFDIDAAVESKEGRIIEPPVPTLVNDLTAERFVYEIDMGSTTTKVLQLTAIDSTGGQVFGIAIGCSKVCFDANRTQINRIIEEFEVTK